MAPKEGATKPRDPGAAKRHAMAYARSLVSRRTIQPQASRQWPTMWGRAIAWLAPWGSGEYPGVRRTVEGLLAGRSTWSAFKMWRGGARTAPPWFALVLADMIEARCRAGLAIVTELRDYRAPVHRNRGAVAVQADGRDRRGGRIGRTGGRLGTNQAGETRGNSPPKSSLIEPDLPCPKPSIPDDMSQ